MTIAEVRAWCKARAAKIPRDTAVVLLLVLASLASFGLGYLSAASRGQGAGLAECQSSLATTSAAGALVASRSGTKYYLPWCAGAARIAEANRIWFQSPADATAQGYTPAANCPGI